MSGGKVSHEGASLLRTERRTDTNKQVRPHIHLLIIRQRAPGGLWDPLVQIHILYYSKSTNIMYFVTSTSPAFKTLQSLSY